MVTEAREYKKLIAKIKRADSLPKKTNIWQDADLTRDQSEQVVREMILSLPKGHYKLHDREYGTNIVDKMWETYGWMPSMLVSEPMMLGLQALYPDKVYASFTHGLDALELKSPKESPTEELITSPEASKAGADLSAYDYQKRKRKIKSPPKSRPPRIETGMKGLR